MMFNLLFVASLSGTVLAIMLPEATASPTLALPARRSVAAPIPTFTFGPIARNLPLQIRDPQPSGESLQIYLTGIYDDIPENGKPLVLGPDFRERVRKTMDENCVGKSVHECRNALVPVFHTTDLKKHEKRVVVTLSVVLASYLIALIATEIVVIAIAYPERPVPLGIKFEHSDLAQLHSIGTATEIAEFITVKTLIADNGEHKKGDIVYHVPDSAATHIRDFLGILGAEQMSKECQGTQKQADPPCLARRTRQLGRLFEDGPENLIQLARMNPPLAAPGPGQAVGVPIQNIAIDGVLVVRFLACTNRNAHPTDPGQVDVVALAQSAAIVAIISHVLAYYSGSMKEVWVPQDQLVKEATTEDIACPRQIACISPECGGQKEGVNDASGNSFCKMASHCDLHWR
ncbi:hypothetical protein EJ02DRAFT_475873 [Clathrospora elynae]|uniref:Uncharacterized protein n=1 Tax=Clathrospora elynae TaxID=706981 RepID=A0A6A5T0U7_9PLEO|nr:hypothetical protein EJ02DRAFT_475873 [Clathrospora elynae]